MKTFLCSIMLMFAGLSLASAEEKTLLRQVREIEARLERIAATAPMKPIVEIKKDEVVITSNDIDQKKDAIVELRPEDAKKSICVVVAKMKRTVENGKPVIYSSFGKKLHEQFRNALSDIDERYPEIEEARLKNQTDVRAHIAAAEKALGLSAEITPDPTAKKPVPLSIAERTYRVTWMGSFEYVSQDMLFEFE